KQNPPDHLQNVAAQHSRLRTAGAIHHVFVFGSGGQVPKQLADVEPAGGVSYQGEGVAGLKLPTGDTFGEIAAQPGGTRAHGGGREVIKVMQRYPLAALGTGFFPCLKLGRHARIVLNLAERVETGETRHQHDMDTTTFGSRRSFLRIGHGFLSRADKAALGWQRVRFIQTKRALKGGWFDSQVLYTPKRQRISVITTFLFAEWVFR